MSGQHDVHAIKEQLDAIEQELRSLELWGGEDKRPSDSDLNSQTPFCLDTIEFHEWLEYVLIERFRIMIAAGAPLPAAMTVHTYAQEQYRGQWGVYRSLIGALQTLDNLITIESNQG